MAGIPPAAAAGATLGCSALLMLPFALTHWPSAPVPLAAWGSAVAWSAPVMRSCFSTG
jgi:hypothetical protein